MGLTPADGCPDCLAVVRPFRLRWEPARLVAFYRCSGCDHAWFTSWNRDTLEEAS